MTIIAILNLVFGGLWLLCGMVSLGMQVSGMQNMFMNFGNMNPSNNPQLAKQQEIQKEILEFTKESNRPAAQYASNLQTLVLSIMLIVSGIGLLRMQLWGRVLALVYGTVSILSHIAVLVYMFMVNVPVAQAFAEKMAAKGEQEKMMGSLMQFGIYVGMAVPIVSMIYPAIVLILMLRPAVAAAFRGEPAPTGDAAPASEHIEEDDRWGRG
ncbi:MAG TPA: hypothetical protein VGY66_26670 [Gemmataceae bacterium]|nr:hypothetical protein [Gemmataceae bacterium]